MTEKYRREYKSMTCSQCDKSLGWAINPKSVPVALCDYCAEWQDDFHTQDEGES